MQGLVPMHGCLLFFRHPFAGLHFQNAHLVHSPQIPYSIRIYIEILVLAKDNYIWLIKRLGLFQSTLPGLWVSRRMFFEDISELLLMSFHPFAWRRPINIWINKLVFLLCVVKSFNRNIYKCVSSVSRFISYLSNSCKISYNSSWRAASCPDSRAFASTKWVKLE